MTRSAKRKEHDRRKAQRLLERAREVLGPDTGPVRCNCENSACAHRGGSCSTPGSRLLKIRDLGSVCSTCWLSYSVEDRVPHGFTGRVVSSGTHRFQEDLECAICHDRGDSFSTSTRSAFQEHIDEHKERGE